MQFFCTSKPLDYFSGRALQYDAFDLGIITTDEFTNAEILEATYPTVRERLLKDLERDADRRTPICVVTGFLGKVRSIFSWILFTTFLRPSIFKGSISCCYRFGLMAYFICTLLMQSSANDLFLCRVLKRVV